jgi:hypothetical protein
VSVPNTTPGTAIAINLPWTLEIDISATNIPTAAWYSFTTSASAYLLSMQVANDHTYFPDMLLYESDGTTRVTSPNGVMLTADWSDPTNQPVQPSTAYYLKVEGDNSAPDSTLATFEVSSNPNLTMPAGTIVISNDEAGFPALAMSQAGIILRATPFSTGENADILTSGEILSDTRNDSSTVVGTLELRNSDSTFSLITSIDDPLSTDSEYAITSDHSTKFWIAAPRGLGSPFTFKSVTPSGTVSGTTYSPSTNSLAYCAVKLDNSLFYYTVQVAGDPIRTFNITGNMDGSNFAAGVATMFAKDIVVLSDGTLIVAFTNNSDHSLDFVRHYSAAGATLHNYAVTSGYQHDHFCRNDESATDFIWWQQSVSGTDPFLHLIQRIKLSDGSVLDSISQSAYEGGTANDPADRFGASKSCPIFVLTIEIPVDVVPPVVGTVTTRKMRRVRRAPHLWDGEVGARIFYPGFQLLVETGADRPDLTTIARYALRWSDDGGFTWSNEYWVDAGTIGQYKLRALWRRLGYSRDRIFEVIDDFDGKSTILDALLVPDPIQGAG